jgi:hypothetical protein
MSLKLSSITNFSGFAADKSEWRRFGQALFLIVVVPLLFMVLLSEFVGWRLGEDTTPEDGARRQTADPSLLWYSENFDTHYRFKLARLEQEKPAILGVGHSRLGKLRSQMFQPYSFYDLSRVSWPFSAYTEMIHRLPKDYSPKVIVFNLDFFMFDPKYSSYYYTKAFPNAEKSTWRDHINMLRKCFMAISRNPLVAFASPLDPVHKRPAIGIMPSLFGDGYRADGSQSGRSDRPLIQPDLLKQVKWNNDPSFNYCDAMSPKALADLEEFANAAHTRGISLIGIQMPIYSPVLRVFEKDPGFGILKDYRQHLAGGYFDRLGIIALDYSDFPPDSNDPRYFSDAIHPTEVLTGAVILKMESDPRIKALLPEINAGDLRARVQEAGRTAQHISLYHD